MSASPNGVAAAPAPPRRTLLRFLYDFWARPIRAEPLAMFRILIGACTLLSLVTSLGPRLPRDLGPDGLCPAAAADAHVTKRNFHFCVLLGPINVPFLDEVLPHEYALAWRDWCEDTDHAYLLFGVLVAAVACMTLGLLTRPATIVAWALFISFNQRLPWVLNGGDSMMRCALFFLMFAPSGAALSLDRLLWRWLRRGGARTAEPVLIPPWSVRLMQVQLALIYLFTGFSKIGGDWIDGEAVYWVLNDTSLNRVPYSWLPVPLFVCRLLSWGTLVFELGFPLFAMFPRRRRFVLEVQGKSPADGFRCAVTIPALLPWALLAGIALHLGILAHTEVGWFTPSIVAWYALYLPGDAVRNFVQLRWWRRQPGAGAPRETVAQSEPQPSHPVAV